MTVELPVGWTARDAGSCRSCKAEVIWATHDVSGKRAPFDLATGAPHFSTCPQADYWRKPK